MKRNGTQRILFLSHANFLTHAKILWTYATHDKILTHAILFFFFFDPRQNFINPRHSRHPRQNLTDQSRDPRYLTHYFLL